MERLTNVRFFTVFILFVFGQFVMAQSTKEQESNKEIRNSIVNLLEYPNYSSGNEQEGIVHLKFRTDENGKIQVVRFKAKDEVCGGLKDAAKEALSKFEKTKNAKLLAKNHSYQIALQFIVE